MKCIFVQQINVDEETEKSSFIEQSRLYLAIIHSAVIMSWKLSSLRFRNFIICNNLCVVLFLHSTRFGTLSSTTPSSGTNPFLKEKTPPHTHTPRMGLAGDDHIRVIRLRSFCILNFLKQTSLPALLGLSFLKCHSPSNPDSWCTQEQC